MKTKGKSKILTLIAVICITAMLASVSVFFAAADGAGYGPKPSEEIIIGDWGIIVYPDFEDTFITYEYVEPMVCVCSYYGSETSLVIPAEIGCYKIDCVGNYWSGKGIHGFNIYKDFNSYENGVHSNDTITEVAISDGIRYISKYAFGDVIRDHAFKNLQSVIIPKSVTEIGDEAFADCTNLKSIAIPNSVTHIGSEAFYECESLENINISENVISIGSGAFRYTADYNTESNWDNGILYIDNCLVEVDKEKTANDIIIQQGTRIISDDAFRWLGELNSVVIPDSVISIGNEAFSDCYKLTKFNIPESVIYIGGCAFYETAYYNNEENWSNNALYLDRCLIGTKGSGKLLVTDGTRLISDFGYSTTTDGYTEISVPKSVTIINGFSSKAYKIYGYKNSAAEEYVSNNPKCKDEHDGYYNTISRIFISLDDGTAYLYNSGVSVSGKESSLPTDALLTVTKEDNAKDSRVIFDITLTVDGKEIQPNGTVTVKIPVPETMDGEGVKVYREEADGTLTDMNAIYQNGYMVFTTDHFSRYILESAIAENPDDDVQKPGDNPATPGEDPKNPDNPQTPSDTPSNPDDTQQDANNNTAGDNSNTAENNSQQSAGGNANAEEIPNTNNELHNSTAICALVLMLIATTAFGVAVIRRKKYLVK